MTGTVGLSVAGLAPALPTAAEQVIRRRQATPSKEFVPLPPPSGPPPFRLRLADVLAPDRMAAIDRAGLVRFHCVGDTGGWRDGRPQRGVTEAMVDELHGHSPDAHPRLAVDRRPVHQCP